MFFFCFFLGGGGGGGVKSLNSMSFWNVLVISAIIIVY